jgi:hypothetical protein
VLLAYTAGDATLTRMVPAADFFFMILTASDSGSLGGMIRRSQTMQYESNDMSSSSEGERNIGPTILAKALSQ